ncbi:hypothetical protein GYMLUDRAFT_58662 [Collybiopsis luxurians FD-317 M1]|uniref:RNA polymerase-associated protein LEO1 n=1 Tax=Collybiopsis luxurians FD-317 M1 TaxID=944289 RepID=A0A0D0C070_9AGAR|nr:hypothetical protein GYMLUDRAFT_58662 [Collybiopsis luxurians FD-317 M1]
MSSLAGALISPDFPSSFSQVPNDDLQHETHLDMKSEYHPNDDEDEEMADLFGGDAQVEPSTHGERQISPGDTTEGSERLGSAEAEQRRALEYEEDEIPPEVAIEEREANVAFPNLPVPSSSDKDVRCSRSSLKTFLVLASQNWVIRLPNFVKMDSKPFHPDTYIGPEHEEDDAVQQAETLREKSMTIKLKLENTIRWKWIKDEFSGDRRQSNSRIIRWSDGTLSLRLGKELFDITQDIDTSGAVPRKTLGSSQSQSQSQSQPPPSTAVKSHGLTYLVAQHKRSQVLQAEAVVTGYMSLRPTGMQSETHRMLVRAVGQKHNKVARLRMAPDPTMDPEREKAALMKTAKKSTRRRSAASSEWGGNRSRKSYSRKAGDWSDEEHFDGDEEGGMSARKKRHRDDDETGGGRYQNDGFVVEDESDDDADFDDDRRKRRREEDPLDKLEAKIQRQENKRRRGSVEDSDAEEEEPMEVESEEEEQKVRRGGGSKRRAAMYDDEDEE